MYFLFIFMQNTRSLALNNVWNISHTPAKLYIFGFLRIFRIPLDQLPWKKMTSVTSHSPKLAVCKGDSKIAKKSYLVTISWIISSVPLYIWTWSSRFWWRLSFYSSGSCFEKIQLNQVGQLHPKLETSVKNSNFKAKYLVH